MTQDPAATALPIAPPALSSPEFSDVPDFVTQSGVSFGWSDGQFRVYKFKWSGGQAVLGRWPLGSDGWRLAWNYMRADHPELAGQVLGACFRREEKLGAQSDRATLADEHPIQILRGWTLAAAQGWDVGLRVGDSVEVYFTEEAVSLTRAGAAVALSSDQATETQMHMQLAEVQARVAQPKGVEVTDRLIRLGERLDTGQLTQEEFAAAKAKLLA